MAQLPLIRDLSPLPAHFGRCPLCDNPERKPEPAWWADKFNLEIMCFKCGYAANWRLFQ